MIEFVGKRYWIVGASEGLGRALAHKLSRAGAHLILSARSEDRLRELAAELPGRAQVVACDVTDADGVARAAAEAAHSEEWLQQAEKRIGTRPTIDYFDAFMIIDNAAGTVTEYPEDGADA